MALEKSCRYFPKALEKS